MENSAVDPNTLHQDPDPNLDPDSSLFTHKNIINFLKNVQNTLFTNCL